MGITNFFFNKPPTLFDDWKKNCKNYKISPFKKNDTKNLENTLKKICSKNTSIQQLEYAQRKLKLWMEKRDEKTSSRYNATVDFSNEIQRKLTEAVNKNFASKSHWKSIENSPVESKIAKIQTDTLLLKRDLEFAKKYLNALKSQLNYAKQNANTIRDFDFKLLQENIQTVVNNKITFERINDKDQKDFVFHLNAAHPNVFLNDIETLRNKQNSYLIANQMNSINNHPTTRMRAFLFMPLLNFIMDFDLMFNSIFETFASAFPY